MELLKKNIHMACKQKEAVTQVLLEDDLNLPENKPDVSTIYLERAKICIEEVRPGNDCVHIRGKLQYELLYQTLEPGCSLVLLEGSLALEEKINREGIVPTDAVTVVGRVDDLTVGIINSRKLQLQSVVTIRIWVEEIQDVMAPVGITGEEPVEYRRQEMDLAQMTVDKKDVFRIKEEVTLPSAYPNLYQILWRHVSLADVECKVLDGKLNVQGEVQLFLLYEGEGEDHPIRSYETMIPFAQSLECHGCAEGMIPHIRYELGQQEILIKPDLDGEARNIAMDLLVDLDIHIYGEETAAFVTDLYGVRNQIEPITETVAIQQLLTRITGKTKVTDRIKIASGSAPILQLLHTEGEIFSEPDEIVENGLQLQGMLAVKVLYITGDDEVPYARMSAQIPYQYTLEIPGITTDDIAYVQPGLEQLQVSMLDGEEIDVKAILTFSTIVFRPEQLSLMQEVQVEPLDHEKMRNLPGIVIYTVKPGDSLWRIGRKYYVSVDSLKEWNGLTGDELKIGQKLLIVKE